VGVPNSKECKLEKLTLSRAIRLCTNAYGEESIQLELLDGSYLLSFSNNRYELLPMRAFTFDSFYFPYESTQVLDALSGVIVEYGELEILAYVGTMALGGVEQNTIAVLKEMKRASAILASKRPAADVGDLTAEAMKAGIPVITLISANDQACDLHTVSEKFKIEWLWICNWSTEDEARNVNFHARDRSFRIADQRSYDHRVGWINTITLDYVRNVDAVIATNAPIKLRLINDFGNEHESKIKIIRSALRFNISQMITQRSNHTNCTFYQISRIVPQKRIDRGLELSNTLRSVGFEDSWRVVGDGHLRPVLEISSWDNQFIEFLGFQDSLEALKSACALVQTSDFEGLPLVIIEALSLGIPVFSTNTGDLGWLREQLPESCRSLLELVDLDDIDRIGDYFIKWRVGFESVCNLSVRQNAARVVRELFSLSKSADEYSRVFKYLEYPIHPIEFQSRQIEGMGQ
jgi:hypothetical protein